MRVKSEAKRSDIVRVASELFESVGFERTSMSMISERLGGSKQTLYNYFPSKDDLLRAVLQQDVGEGIEVIEQAFHGHKDLRDALASMGAAYLNRRLSPQPIANIRIVANQPAETKLGAEFFEQALRPAAKRICGLFESLMEDGKLERADPWIVAMQWKGLTEQDLFERRLLGAMPKLDQKEIERAAGSAADAILKIYGLGAPPPKKPVRKPR
jgi:AcrR family transcriptional regulator